MIEWRRVGRAFMLLLAAWAATQCNGRAHAEPGEPVHHRVRRTGDDRLIAVASVEKRLRA